MDHQELSGAYLYQDTSIIIRENTANSKIQEEINGELISRVFNEFPGAVDSFVIPSVDGSSGIRGIMLGKGELPKGWRALPLRDAVNIMTGGTMAEGRGDVGRILRSYHIAQWRRESRFCGSCGKANLDLDTGEPGRKCPSCGRLEFPRISPAVITVITNGKGEALLAHNKKFAPGVYSLIAGFNEAGENLESTVEREAMEEVNISVSDIRYIRSQPWPFPNSLMVGFSAVYSGGELKPDGIEIEDARWFTRDELPLLPGNGSVSRYLIDLWREGRL